MTNIVIEMLLIALASLSMTVDSETYQLATTIEKSDGTVVVDARGYAKMNLITVEVNHQGEIALNGALAVEGGEVNVVLWARVEGKYYFSRLPGLQGFKKADMTDFAIPFSSPESPITEAILDVELPNGGKLEIGDIELSKG